MLNISYLAMRKAIHKVVFGNICLIRPFDTQTIYRCLISINGILKVSEIDYKLITNSVFWGQKFKSKFKLKIIL